MLRNEHVVRVEAIKPGMVLARSVLTEKGKVLLQQGSFLTKEHICNLFKWRILTVSIFLPYSSRSSQRRLFSVYNDALQQVAVTFESVRKFKEVPIAKCKELVGNYIELLANVVGVIDMLHTVKSHSEYTFEHSLNVAILSGVLGKWMGLKGEQLKEVILAGLLHDLGKMLIPKAILEKPGKLSDDEMAIVRTHPGHSYHLLADCTEISAAVKSGIFQHHEREDGSGYPLGSIGKEIHVYAKIVAVADMYDAMSTERVYRRRVPLLIVAETILEQIQDKLNPQICLTFLESMHNSLLGSSVLLSNGSKAKVVLLNDLLWVRPVVRMEDGEIINLARNKKLEVVAVLEEETA